MKQEQTGRVFPHGEPRLLFCASRNLFRGFEDDDFGLQFPRTELFGIDRNGRAVAVASAVADRFVQVQVADLDQEEPRFRRCRLNSSRPCSAPINSW